MRFANARRPREVLTDTDPRSSTAPIIPVSAMASAGTTPLIAKRSILLLLKPSLRALKPGQALSSSKHHARRVRSSDLSAGTYHSAVC
jgi:hypothetical protein